MNRIGSGDIQRLWTPHTIDVGVGERIGKISQIKLVVQLAVPVDDHEDVAPPG